MRESVFYKTTILLSIIGIVLASFLLYNYITRPVVELCTISERINCDAVTKGVLATLFGVPVSLIGLVGYITILISACLKFKKVILAVSLFGLIFCLRLTFLEIFSVRVICPVCISCQIDMLAIFFLSLFAVFKKPSVTQTL